MEKYKKNKWQIHNNIQKNTVMENIKIIAKHFSLNFKN